MLLLSACGSTTEPAKPDDYEATLRELEKRVEHLEQGLDERVGIRGKIEAAETELFYVQTAVVAAMADSGGWTIADPTPSDFGDVDQVRATPGVDVTVHYGPDGLPGTADDCTVGAFIAGGVDSVQGSYNIQSDGTVNRMDYPGLP